MKLYIYILHMMALGCLTLPSTGAEYYNWNYGGPPKITQNGLGNYLENRVDVNSEVTVNGMMKTETKTLTGQAYMVSIESQKIRKTRECKEEIKISRFYYGQEKSIKRKCNFPFYPTISPKMINIGDFLLVNRPEDTFCVFSTNGNEIVYLLDGKWKKGKYNNDNTNDKELTWTEVEELKESINWWLTYYGEYYK